ncbi:MAG: FtsX-like permease family protein, partial [Asgard group archaeon]|nr:FtsX-like permease family protein [Asgard group archaeon]
DSELLNKSRLSLDDIISLENESTILLNKKHAREQKVKPGEFYQTEHFTRYDNNLSLINTYEYFPMMPLAWKPLFTRQLDVFTIVGHRETIRDIVGSVDFTTEVLSYTVKLIRPVNDSVIPLIQQQLEDQGYETTTYNEVYLDLIDDVKVFAKNNLRFFSLLSSLILVFIGFYTGVTIYEERKRIMDSLYRSGAVRHQILGFFTLENIMVNLFPILITMLSVLPLLKLVSTFFLGLQNLYFPFKPGIPWWLILLLVLLGIGLSLIGWLVAIAPAIYRYRPVKQE